MLAPAFLYPGSALPRSLARIGRKLCEKKHLLRRPSLTKSVFVAFSGSFDSGSGERPLGTKVATHRGVPRDLGAVATSPKPFSLSIRRNSREKTATEAGSGLQALTGLKSTWKGLVGLW